jgi:hypothetical protein
MFRIRIYMDPHHFGTSDLHLSEKLDPDRHISEKLDPAALYAVLRIRMFIPDPDFFHPDPGSDPKTRKEREEITLMYCLFSES